MFCGGLTKMSKDVVNLTGRACIRGSRKSGPLVDRGRGKEFKGWGGEQVMVAKYKRRGEVYV